MGLVEDLNLDTMISSESLVPSISSKNRQNMTSFIFTQAEKIGPLWHTVEGYKVISYL